MTDLTFPHFTHRHMPCLTRAASESQKQKFKANAQVAATRDAKRALRESGYYETHELDAIDEDEKHGHKIM